MTKNSLARMQFRLTQLKQMQENSTEKLTEILSSAFSALATCEPEVALDIINQLEENRPNIEALITQRKDEEDEFVAEIANNLPDTLELEE